MPRPPTSTGDYISATSISVAWGMSSREKISRDDTSRRPTNSVSCAPSSVFWRRPRDLQRNGKTNLNVDGIADGENLQSSLSLGLFIHRVESRLLFIVE